MAGEMVELFFLFYFSIYANLFNFKVISFFIPLQSEKRF